MDKILTQSKGLPSGTPEAAIDEFKPLNFVMLLKSLKSLGLKDIIKRIHELNVEIIEIESVIKAVMDALTRRF